MKSVIIKIVVVAFICLNPILLSAQEFRQPVMGNDTDLSKTVSNKMYSTDSLQFDLTIDIAEQLLPLDTLLIIAVNNSPSMKFEEASIERNIQHMRYNRYLFFNGISAFYNYTQGDQISLIQNAGADPMLSNAFGIGTRYGFNVVFPISELVARPYKMKQLKNEITMSKFKKDEMAIEVKRKVINDYFNMIAAQRVLNIRIQDAESARITFEIAQIEMKRGKIHPQELSRLRNLYAIAESNLELSKKEFMIFYYQLETMLGVKLHDLKRTK